MLNVHTAATSGMPRLHNKLCDTTASYSLTLIRPLSRFSHNCIHRNRIANGGVAVPAQICALQQKQSGGAYIDEGNARLTIDGDRCQCEHRELNKSCGPRCNCPKEVCVTHHSLHFSTL
jgi:hypothetical protein